MLTTLVATAVISNARSNRNFDSLDVAVYVDQLIRSRCVSIHGEVCTCESVCAVDDFLSQNMPFTRHNPFDDLVSMRRLQRSAEYDVTFNTPYLGSGAAYCSFHPMKESCHSYADSLVTHEDQLDAAPV